MNIDPDNITDRSGDGSHHPAKSMDIVRPSAANPVRAKAPTKSGTLMRSAVSKPGTESAPKISALSMLQSADDDVITIDPKDSLPEVDHARQMRAKSIERSDLIERFRVPTDNDHDDFSPAPVLDDQPAANDPPTQPPQLYKPVDHSNVSSALQPSMDIFEKSLMQATAENKPPLAKRRRRSKIKLGVPALLISSLLVLMAGGVYAYDNSSKLSLYVASSRAGFQASLPGYQPSGYSLGSVSAGSGVVQTAYHSNNNSGGYTINEKKSSWDNQTLLNNYVFGISGDNYETVSNDGKTIYIYGSNNATWIYKGIWYIVTANQSLSVHQLIQLAATS